MCRTLLVALLAVVTPLLITPFAAAGPIEPPPGPVAPTGRTVILSLPYTISEPGTYYLGRHLTAPPHFSGAGITITASSVTLDLNGFSLAGPRTFSGTALNISGARITITNG